jgi:molybdenum-dependent DNA-binding transcriptional regulator ModE
VLFIAFIHTNNVDTERGGRDGGWAACREYNMNFFCGFKKYRGEKRERRATVKRNASKRNSHFRKRKKKKRKKEKEKASRKE